MVTPIHHPTTHSCEERAVERTSSIESPYHYVNSGLENVYLVGVKYYVCQKCGKQSAEIPALEHLLTAIARTLVGKASGLTGAQLRFLRKRLSKRAVDFAQIMSMTPPRLSTLEASRAPIPESRDKLVRMIYKVLSGDPRLLSRLQEPKEVERWLTSIHGSGAAERIIGTWQRNHQWKVESEVIAA